MILNSSDSFRQFIMLASSQYGLYSTSDKARNKECSDLLANSPILLSPFRRSYLSSTRSSFCIGGDILLQMIQTSTERSLGSFSIQADSHEENNAMYFKTVKSGNFERTLQTQQRIFELELNAKNQEIQELKQRIQAQERNEAEASEVTANIISQIVAKHKQQIADLKAKERQYELEIERLQEREQLLLRKCQELIQANEIQKIVHLQHEKILESAKQDFIDAEIKKQQKIDQLQLEKLNLMNRNHELAKVSQKKSRKQIVNPTKSRNTSFQTKIEDRSCFIASRIRNSCSTVKKTLTPVKSNQPYLKEVTNLSHFQLYDGS